MSGLYAHMEKSHSSLIVAFCNNNCWFLYFLRNSIVITRKMSMKRTIGGLFKFLMISFGPFKLLFAIPSTGIASILMQNNLFMSFNYLYRKTDFWNILPQPETKFYSQFTCQIENFPFITGLHFHMNGLRFPASEIARNE